MKRLYKGPLWVRHCQPKKTTTQEAQVDLDCAENTALVVDERKIIQDASNHLATEVIVYGMQFVLHKCNMPPRD